MMAKMFRDGDQWRLKAIGQGIAVTSRPSPWTSLARFL